MELKELSAEHLTEIYDQYMVIDFPQDELKPLERILYMIRTGLSCAYGIYEGEELRGYATFIIPDGLRYGLLDYLAVIREYRGTGVGHVFFDLIGDTLAERYPALRGFFIESEDIAYAADAKERRIREKRISFYEQNGCLHTPLGSRLFGVTYSVLLYDYRGDTDAAASIGDVDGIYRAMFPERHYERDVELWEIAEPERVKESVCPRQIRTSAKAVIIRDGKLLAIKLNDGGEEWYILPGGGQDCEEVLPQTVEREVREETGIEVQCKDLLFVIEGVHGERFHRIDLVFLCDYLGNDPDATLHKDTNQIGYDWLDLSVLNRLPLFPSKLRRPIMDFYEGKEYVKYLGNEVIGDPE